MGRGDTTRTGARSHSARTADITNPRLDQRERDRQRDRESRRSKGGDRSREKTGAQGGGLSSEGRPGLQPWGGGGARSGQGARGGPRQQLAMAFLDGDERFVSSAGGQRTPTGCCRATHPLAACVVACGAGGRRGRSRAPPRPGYWAAFSVVGQTLTPHSPPAIRKTPLLAAPKAKGLPLLRLLGQVS